MPRSAAAIRGAIVGLGCPVLVFRLEVAAVEALAYDDLSKMVGLCGDEICCASLVEGLYRLGGVLSALPDKSGVNRESVVRPDSCHRLSNSESREDRSSRDSLRSS
jgi:hypothetical protein